MKRINITTAQNVSIELKGATVLDRMIAWLIDVCIIVVSALILSIAFMALLPDKANLIWMVIITSYMLYFLVFEIFVNGSSPGKKVMGLRVVKLTGEPPVTYDYFIRWAFRLIDIGLTFGCLAIISISSSVKNQRVGDFLAGTTVIKLRKSSRLKLNKILELNELRKHEPQYPEVTALSEENMMLIKEVADRYKKLPNDAHRKALFLTIAKAEELLGIKAKEKNASFLYTLIKDYVALTR